MTYQTYEEERASDQRFEAHQERLAQEADEMEERTAYETHRFDFDNVCTECGHHADHVVGMECEPPEVTRRNQRAEECYVVGTDSDEPDTVFVVSPDGVGRHWFDTEAEALADWPGVKVNYVETADE